MSEYFYPNSNPDWKYKNIISKEKNENLWDIYCQLSFFCSLLHVSNIQLAPTKQVWKYFFNIKKILHFIKKWVLIAYNKIYVYETN